MALDLSSLRDALAALNASLGYLESDLAKDAALKDQFRAAAIQAFEFTYELAFKFMKRQLEEIVPVPSAVDENDLHAGGPLVGRSRSAQRRVAVPRVSRSEKHHESLLQSGERGQGGRAAAALRGGRWRSAGAVGGAQS